MAKICFNSSYNKYTLTFFFKFLETHVFVLYFVSIEVRCGWSVCACPRHLVVMATMMMSPFPSKHILTLICHYRTVAWDPTWNEQTNPKLDSFNSCQVCLILFLAGENKLTLPLNILPPIIKDLCFWWQGKGKLKNYFYLWSSGSIPQYNTLFIGKCFLKKTLKKRRKVA